MPVCLIMASYIPFDLIGMGKIVKPYCVTPMIQLAVTKIEIILATGTTLMVVLLKALRTSKDKVAPCIISLGTEEEVNLLYAYTAPRTIILLLRGGISTVTYMTQLEVVTNYNM